MVKITNLVAMASALLLCVCAAASAAEIRVMAPIWITDYGEAESYDLDGTQAEAVSILLAAKHFNERRADIIPALANVSECEKNITIVAVCDESGNKRRTTKLLNEFKGEYDIVVGMSSTAVITAATYADVNEDAPLISYWATDSSLSDKTNFPLFARTFFADRTYFDKLSQFLAALDFTDVAILYVNDDIAPEMSNQLYYSLSALGINALSFSFEYDDPDSIRDAMVKIKQTDINVIVYLGWETDFTSYIPSIAKDIGLNSPENLWIYTIADALPSSESIASGEELKDLLRGSLLFTFVNQDSMLTNSFLELFSSEFAHDTFLVSDFNQKLPPFGGQNDSTGCKNDPLDFSLPTDYFATFNTLDVHISRFAAYDAVMAVGLAACADPSASMPETGSDFVELIRNVSFQGLSGSIQFDENGDRKESNTLFIIKNWQPENDDLTLVNVGTWVDSKWEYNINNILFRAGKGLAAKPGTFSRPDEKFNYLSPDLRALGYAEVAITIFFTFICLGWMYRNLDSPIIRASQPVFMTIMCLGCIVAIIAIIPLTADDNPNNPIQGGDYACIAAPYMFFLGFQAILGAVIGKTIRAYSIYERKSLYHQRVRMYHIFLLIAILLIVNLVLLFIWGDVAPFAFVRIPMVLDRHGQVVESRAECSLSVNPRGNGFFASLVVLFGLSILGLRYVSSLATKRFVEEKQLSIMLFQTYILVLPAVIAAYSSVVGRFVILSSYMLLSVILVLIFTFYPKYAQINEMRNKVASSRKADSDQRQFSTTGAVSSANDVDILDGIRIPMVQAKFAKYAEENYVTESFLFLVDVLQFKEEFASRPNAWKIDKARSIMHVYIDEGSLLQVNISERVRHQVQVRYKNIGLGKETLTEDAFDPAIREVASMLDFGVWGQFVQEGGMYNVRNEEIPRSKLFSWMHSDTKQDTSKKVGNSRGSDLSTLGRQFSNLSMGFKRASNLSQEQLQSGSKVDI